MLIREETNERGRHYDFTSVGAYAQSRFSVRRPWHAAATMASLLLMEDRGLIVVASVSGVSAQTAIAQLAEYWTLGDAPNVENANIVVATSGNIILLPRDREGIEAAAKFIWDTADHWFRIIPDRDYHRRLASQSLDTDAARSFIRACNSEFVLGLEPDYVALDIEAGPNYIRLEPVIDICVSRFNEIYQ